MDWKNKTFQKSLGHAWDGLKIVWQMESNFRRQLLVSVVVLLSGLFFQLHWMEWIVLVFAIALVLLMEIWNTTVEYLTDLITDNHYHILAKRAKDVAAGGVVLASVIAVLVGMIIFLPKLLNGLL
ncbi:diacylglycerol kinase family protein [Atopobacter phocae]|uniref:diacylglycerol kinase family protein n=1 Tax=Atopobacter phocae TaxID=136492 RepID=UPI00046EE96D|nr:diacylglycerol kinase family protein [Atopobacter phocae]